MSEPLKILTVTTVDLTAWCFLRSWFRTLTERGAKVTLTCTVGRFRDDLEATGAEVLHVPISRELSPLEDFSSLLDLVWMMRRVRPDVVHTHTSKAGFLGRLAARLAGVPVIVHTIHELPENSTRNPWKKALYWGLEFLAARWATHLVTVSEANRRQILAEWLCRSRDLTLVREGLDLSLYEARRTPAEVRAELGLPPGAPLIGSVGRLEPAKGHEDLLEAFRLVLERKPEARLVVVGHGYLEESLRARARSLGLEGRVCFTGWREDLLDLVGAMDVFALASHYEGLGVAILEAMALSRPVVCTAVGGVNDVVVDGETGFLVPAREPARMAERLVEVLADPARAAELGAAGRRRVEEHFQDQEANRQMLCLYQNLLARKSPGDGHPLGPRGA